SRQRWCRTSHTTRRPVRSARASTSTSANERSSFSITSRPRADHRVLAQAHRVEQARLHLQLSRRRRLHCGILGVENGVLPRVSGQADTGGANEPAELSQLLRTLAHLV